MVLLWDGMKLRRGLLPPKVYGFVRRQTGYYRDVYAIKPFNYLIRWATKVFYCLYSKAVLNELRKERGLSFDWNDFGPGGIVDGKDYIPLRLPEWLA